MASKLPICQEEVMTAQTSCIDAVNAIKIVTASFIAAGYTSSISLDTFMRRS